MFGNLAIARRTCRSDFTSPALPAENPASLRLLNEYTKTFRFEANLPPLKLRNSLAAIRILSEPCYGRNLAAVEKLRQAVEIPPNTAYWAVSYSDRSMRSKTGFSAPKSASGETKIT